VDEHTAVWLNKAIGISHARCSGRKIPILQPLKLLLSCAGRTTFSYFCGAGAAGAGAGAGGAGGGGVTGAGGIGALGAAAGGGVIFCAGPFTSGPFGAVDGFAFGAQPSATTRSNTQTTANVFFIFLSFPNLAILPRLTLSWNKAFSQAFQVKPVARQNLKESKSATQDTQHILHSLH